MAAQGEVRGRNNSIQAITHLEPPLLPHSYHISPPQAEAGKHLPEGDDIPNCPTNSYSTKEMSDVVKALTAKTKLRHVTAKTKFITDRTKRH